MWKKMGSLGDDKGQIKPSEVKPNTDFSHAQTQPFDFDSQFSLPPFSGKNSDTEDGDELRYLQNTVPFDDYNAYVEDETQVVNLFGETQVLNFDGETQVLDDDLDFFENMETQLLEEFDEEVVMDSDGEGTEVLDDGDEVSNDEVVRGDCGQSLGQEENKESLEQCNASTDEQRSSGIHVSSATPDVKAVPESKSGSVLRFTSVRAASLRASGLAARNTALRRMNSGSCSNRTDSQFSDRCTIDSNGLNPKVVEKINQIHDQGTNDNNLIGLSGNAGAREDLFQFSDCNGPVAGLSYIDSQEPGELSQANALNFVERLVNDNLMELGDEDDLGKKSACGKSKLNSCAKGPQTLAKKTIERSTADKTGIFNWDDLLEDEGGGDFYCRRKDEFYGNASDARKPRSHPQKHKGRKLDESCNADQPNPHEKMTVHSDSKLLFKSKDNGKAVQEGQMNSRKNLLNDFDEQFDSDSSGGQLEATTAKTDAPDLLNVGFDTQMAAEAMEALLNGEGATNQNSNQCVQNTSKSSSKGSFRGKSRKRVSSRESTLGKGISCSGAASVTRRSKRTKSSEDSSILPDKRSKNNRKESDTELLRPKLKKAKSNADEHQIAGGIGICKTPLKRIKQRKVNGALERSQLHGTRKSTRGSSNKEQHAEEFHAFTAIAHRTRQSSVMNMQIAETPASDCRKGRKHKKVGSNQSGNTDIEPSEVSNAKGQLSNLGSNQSGEHENGKSSNTDQMLLELTARSNGNHALGYPKQKRSCRRMSVDVGESDKLEVQSKTSIQQEDDGQSTAVFERSRRNNRSTCIPSTTRRITRSSASTCPALYFADQNSEGKLSHQSSDKQGSGNDVVNRNSTEMNGKMMSTSIIGPEAAKAAKHSDGNHDAVSSPMAESLAVNFASGRSPKEKCRSPGSVCTTPAICQTPINAVSPVCMGEEYYKQSCKTNLSKTSLIKELRSLTPIEPEPISPLKDMRKRRDLASVRVLFSNHLDEDIIKQQKKILARLCISEASTISDATHFITDKFVRTRNMLEAIASGKPVVTHLWLESIGQVNIHIDEEAYILRDIKKEKELGFCMPVSLARARKRPLLQGRRILITPNTKPGKETISHLVTAVHGQAVERIGRSAMKDDKVPDDLLVLSCEEDYAICIPFLEKGAAVYSSELLLNGIVTQKLDYERHHLFADHVRRTRSTIWLKKDNRFQPVTKHK
ncbi:hypothetical protein PTKIN_Ptkin09bG0028200 [Pterospermum kingtungense]